MIGDINAYDSSARALTNAAGAIIVSTEYRHGPESRFPAAHDDTYAAWQWLVANAAALGGLTKQIAVIGESAGGNMAASIAVRSRYEKFFQPVQQVLVYPVTNYAFDSPSQQQNRNAMPLGTADLVWFYERYLTTPADGSNPLFSVLRAPSLAGLAPATVITADIDPLRSEGRFYAQRLADSGVAVDYANYPGVTHEFFGMGAGRGHGQGVADGPEAQMADAELALQASASTVALEVALEL